MIVAVISLPFINIYKSIGINNGIVTYMYYWRGHCRSWLVKIPWPRWILLFLDSLKIVRCQDRYSPRLYPHFHRMACMWRTSPIFVAPPLWTHLLSLLCSRIRCRCRTLRISRPSRSRGSISSGSGISCRCKKWGPSCRVIWSRLAWSSAYSWSSSAW